METSRALTKLRCQEWHPKTAPMAQPSILCHHRRPSMDLSLSCPCFVCVSPFLRVALKCQYCHRLPAAGTEIFRCREQHMICQACCRLDTCPICQDASEKRRDLVAEHLLRNCRARQCENRRRFRRGSTSSRESSDDDRSIDTSSE